EQGHFMERRIIRAITLPQNHAGLQEHLHKADSLKIVLDLKVINRVVKEPDQLSQTPREGGNPEKAEQPGHLPALEGCFDCFRVWQSEIDPPNLFDERP